MGATIRENRRRRIACACFLVFLRQFYLSDVRKTYRYRSFIAVFRLNLFRNDDFIDQQSDDFGCKFLDSARPDHKRNEIVDIIVYLVVSVDFALTVFNRFFQLPLLLFVCFGHQSKPFFRYLSHNLIFIKALNDFILSL